MTNRTAIRELTSTTQATKRRARRARNQLARHHAASRKLLLETLEDRRLLASYTWYSSAGSLDIALGTNERLEISESGGTRSFTLSGGTFTQSGGNTATGNNSLTISFGASDDIGTSISVGNASAGPGTNHVTFNGGTIASSTISVHATNSGTTSAIDFATATTLSGNVTLTANGAGIANSVGSVTITGTAALSAPGQNITLDSGTNNFGGAVSIASGNNVTLNDTGAIDLGASTVSGNLVVTAGGAITDSGNVSVTGNASFSGSSITLGGASETTHFGTLTFSSGGAVSIQEDSATALAGSNSANSLSLTSSGSITQTSGSSIAVANNAYFNGTGITLGASGESDNFGSLTFASGGAVNIQESSGILLTGASSAASLILGTGYADITNAANASLTVTGSASLIASSGINLGNQSGDSVNFGQLTFTSASSTVNIAENSAMQLLGSNAANTLTLSSTGAITDASGTSLTVTGASSVTGTSITLADSGADALAITGAATFNATLGGIAIGALGAVNFGSVVFSATGAVSITEDSSMTVSAASTAGGGLNLVSASDVTLNATIGVTGNTSITAGTTTGDITVNAKLTGSGTIHLDAADSITIDAAIDPSTVDLDADDDITINAAVSADNAINVRAGNDGSGSVTVTSFGSLTTTASGSDILIRAGMISGNISLAGNVTAIDRLTLTALDGASQTGGAITAANLQLDGSGGSGAFSLTQAGNNVDTIAGNTGGAIQYVDADALTVGTVATAGITTSNDNVTLCATSLSLTQNIAAGTATVRLNASSGGITQTGGAVTAAALGLRASGSISLPNANDVDTLAAVVGGTFSFADADGFTIGTVAADGCFSGATGITGATAVELCTGGDLSITQALTSTGTVRLQTTSGSITQNGSGVITAANLGARASANVNLNTLGNVISGTFAAASTGAGVVEFQNNQGFIVGPITGSGCFTATTGATTTSGNIDLDANAGNLTVNNVVTAGAAGTVALNADAGAVNLNAAVSSTSGQIDITADSVNQNTSGNVSTGSGAAINVTADNGSITMASGTATMTVLGAITYSATANVLLSQLTSTSGGAINVTAGSGASVAGAIIDNLSSAAPNLWTSGTATLTAETGIGSTDDINTAIGTLVATNNTSGNIVVRETNGLILGGTGVRTLAGNGNIDIDVDAGDLTINSGSPVTAHGSGTVKLNADAGAVNLNAAVSSTSGQIDITGNSVTQNTGGNISTGSGAAINVTADNGSITMADGTTTTADSGLVTYVATGNVALSLLTISGNVRVTADSDNNGIGAITDNTAAETANIIGNSVALRAGHGIGDGVAPDDADIDVQVNTLAAVTRTGDIHVQDLSGGLVIGTFDGLSGATITVGGGGDDLTIRASSPLTINAPVANNGGGNIVLAAEGSALTDDLTVNADVTASGGNGNISLYAGHSISLANSPVVVTVGAAGTGAVLLSAGTDYNNGSPQNGNAGGDVTMASGSVVRSADGNITVLAPNDVRLSVLNANSNDDGTLGNVVVTADYAGPGGGLANNVGAIIDNLTAETPNIIGNLATLRAATGIGSGGGTADIQTDINTLDAVNSTSGDIVIYEVAGSSATPGNDLDVDTATQLGTSGSILLTVENGNLTVLVGAPSEGVQLTHASNGGTIALDANLDNSVPNEETGGTRGDVVLNNVVTSQGGAITITADHDVLGAVDGVITGGSGGVTIIANENNSSNVGNTDGTIQLAGDISAVGGTVTFSLEDCDGWIGATAGGSHGVVTAANIVMGIDGRAPEGVLRLQAGSDASNNNTFTGTTTVAEGTLIINGVLSGPTVNVQAGGVLGGTGDGAPSNTNPTTGRINANVNVLSGGILEPGDIEQSTCTRLPGVLGINGNVDIAQDGQFRVQLNGLTPSTQYDQLVLIGNGQLHGAVLDGANGATLTVEPGFGIPVGAEFYIVSKIPSGDWTSRFDDLPEGAFLTAGGALMNISYFASDTARSDAASNDIVLTAPGRYDFNGFNGYTATNYMPISPFTAKSGGNSAGWQTLPPRYFERNLPEQPPYSDDTGRLRYDGQSTDRGGSPLTFEVDVVAGKQYEVMILTGDYGWNHDQQRFTVWDGNTTMPDPNDPADAKYIQQVSTWGSGAPDGSGVNVTWGGGAANPDQGFYRWLRFTTDDISGVGLGKLLVRMEDLGGYDPTAVILAMDIRPVEAVGKLTIVRDTPAPTTPEPFSTLAADGMTVDTYSGTGAPPNAWLTVTVSAGSPVQYATVTPDADSMLFGGQVQADSAGNFTFDVLRPATLTNTSASSEDWTILVQESSGLSRGTATQPYEAPEEIAPLRFDIGVAGSPVETGFTQVVPQTLYNPTRGYGWVGYVGGIDYEDSYLYVGQGPNHNTGTPLRRDQNFGTNATFKVDLPDGTYNVRLYFANAMYWGFFGNATTSFAVDVGGAPVNVPVIQPGHTYIAEVSTTVSGGVLSIEFGVNNTGFIISGLDISSGALPAEQALTATGDPLDAGASAITAADLAPIAVQARQQWAATGLTDDQAARLAQTQFVVQDLGGAYLGLANVATNVIRIDDDAARFGWSVDGAPHAGASGAGADLLTVVMHEMGHLLGLDHADEPHDLMAPVLPVASSYATAASAGASSAGGRVSSLFGSLATLDRVWSSPATRTTSLRSDPAVGDDPSLVALSVGSDPAAELVEASVGELRLGVTAKSGDRPAEGRTPRRDRLARYERELDAWFAELADEADADQ